MMLFQRYRNRAIVTLVTTAILSILLYKWRWFTFAVWTNASLIDHQYPRLTVSIIEALVVLAVAKVIWRITAMWWIKTDSGTSFK